MQNSSDDDQERSESGSPIYRYDSQDREFEPAAGDSENIERITDHIEQHIGPVKSVFHELVSDLVHIDIHIVEPREGRDFYTLVTSGMSDLPMTPPQAGMEEYLYSELMICLPPDWKLSEKDLKDEPHYWPIRLLKRLARFPHEYQTWLWNSHTIPNGDPPEPYASNTQLCGAILLSPILVGEEFSELVIDDTKTIHFHALIPLHADEMDLKLAKGSEALFDGFDNAGVSEVLDPGRPSSLPKKKRRGFWRRR